MDWVIGSTDATSDNTAEANTSSGNIIVYLEEDTNLVTAGSQATITIGVDNLANGSSTFMELATTEYLYTTNGTTPATGGTATSLTNSNIYPTQARDDVRNREGAVEGTTSAVVAAVNQTRVHWLGN